MLLSATHLARTALCLFSTFVILLAFFSLSVRQHAATHTAGTRSIASVRPSEGGLKPLANTIAVNTTADVANGADGLCSLREAITAANTNTASGAAAGECGAGTSSGNDTINFSITGTISLASALPNITSNMIINGPGTNILTIQRSAAGGTPQFSVLAIGGTVTLSGLTISNGQASPLVGGGGGIRNLGVLTLVKVSVVANQTINGLPGGGIFNQGTLSVVNSTISGNGTIPNGDGGGIYNSAGIVNLINSTVSDNTTGNGGTQGGNGGGIWNNFFGVVSMTNSVISGNRTENNGASTGFGGGVYNIGTFTGTNITISGNQTGGPASSPGGGGGISNPGTLTLTNATVSGNQTGTATGAPNGYGAGGGIANGGTTRIRNTIVANNVAGGASGPDLSGTFNSQDYNLIKDTTGATVTGTTTHNVTGQDPLLGPLANNGGPTLTRALLSGSPALDAGDNCVTQAAHCGDANIPQLTTEQRGAGFNRIVDGPDADAIATVDIGAFEQQVFLADLTNTSTNEDTELNIPFDAGDTSSITSITATSDTASLVPNDSAHLTAGLFGSTGVVTVNPSLNLFGTVNITITVNRSGGSSSKTIMVTVNSSNDAPTFTRSADQTINEDAGAQTIINWATNMSAGPSDESGQTLTFEIIGNTNPTLFAGAPAISSAGTLTYTPAPNANGSATLTVVLKDNGGTTNGGADTSASESLTVTVNSVNDAPSFSKGFDQTANNNAGAQAVNNWATSISSGPANESGQAVNFEVTGNTNPSLFIVAPAISSTGRLTYQPATNAGGTAAITIVIKDNGGTANGGQDTSSAQTFNINIIPVGGSLKFSAASDSAAENSGFKSITVKRDGDLTRAVTVDYSTSGDPGLACSTPNGVASPKCDFTASLGTLTFGVGEDTKSFIFLINQDTFVEGPETLTVTLSNPTGFSALSTQATETITIGDDLTEAPGNSIDDAGTFVTQHYHDFLNREADSSGLNFWTNQITSCGSDQACIEIKRINVSAAFFLSIEFQGTGYLVERIYKTSYGDVNGTSTFGGAHQLPVPVIRFNEFLPDTQEIGQGIVVGQSGWEQALENNKQAFLARFVQRSRFTTAFPTSLSATQFVDRLNQRAGGVLSATERAQLISDLTTNAKTRAQVLRAVAEDQDLNGAEFNRAFVLMQFFGYLRRNPNDLPDTDYTGYDFWLTKLNQFSGDFVNAEMVKAFLSSSEYRQRFGP